MINAMARVEGAELFEGCGRLGRVMMVSAMLALAGCAGTGQGLQSGSVPVEDDLLYDGVAAITFDSLLTGDDNADFKLLGDRALQAGQQDKAIYAYLRAIQRGGNKAELFARIGDIHKARRNYKLALLAFDRALADDANYIPALVGAGLGYLAIHDHGHAQKLLEHAVAQDRLRLAPAADSGEQVTEALSDASPAPAVPPAYDRQSPHDAYNALGILADLAGDFSRARDYYRTADAIRPGSPATLNNAGYSHYLAGDLASAEHYFRRAITINHNFERAWQNLALVLARRENYSEALTVLNQVMAPAEAHNTMGYICMLQGKHDIADAYFEEAITLSPSYYELAYQNRQKNRLMSGHSSALN